MPINLDRIFDQYPDLPPMRRAAREWLRYATRNRWDGKPLTGSYYWIPDRGLDGRLAWACEEFFDAWLPSSDHSYVWLHVRDVLEYLWRRSLKDIDYCCLPRGRVCRTLPAIDQSSSRSKLVIYHGQDCPLGPTGLRIVRTKFQIGPDVPAIFDEHEQMIAGQPEALSRRLNVDLGLSGVRG